MHGEGTFRSDSLYIVHRLGDLEPRCSGWCRKCQHVDTLRYRVGVARVVQVSVDEHTEVVDDRDGAVDLGMLAAEEPQLEIAELDSIAGCGCFDREVAGGGGNSRGPDDAGIRIHIENAAQLLGRPMVGMFVGDDNADDTPQVA